MIQEEEKNRKESGVQLSPEELNLFEAAKVLHEVSKYNNQDILEKHPNWEEEVNTLTRTALDILEGKQVSSKAVATNDKKKDRKDIKERELEKRRQAINDPTEREMDKNEITLKNIEKYSTSKKEPTEAEQHKAYVRRTYLKKIKAKFQEAKQRNASEEELNKIRAVFEKVKTSKISEKEVDNYDHKMGLYLSKLQFENPKHYKSLYAQYQNEINGDKSHYDDPIFVEKNDNPLEVMDAQFTAIDQFYEEQGHHISDDNIFIDAVRQFDHKNPEDREMKRLVLQWGKNRQEQQFNDLSDEELRTRMASINVLLPNAPMRKPTGHPEDHFFNHPDDENDHNYI
jgi:hypothetical protein